jgi:hypothetical protein
MKAVLFFLACVTASLFSQNTDRKTVPKPEDFAETLSLSGIDGRLMAVEIPEKVYRGVKRPDAGDIRVFDASGNLVPFTVRKPPRETVEIPPESAPFFLWKPSQDKPFPGDRDIEIGVSGSVVKITSLPEQSASSRIYLIDLSGLSHPPSALRIETAHNEVFFNGKVEIHGSSDLNQWRSFGEAQTIAYYGNSSANRNRLEIPAQYLYLLLRFEEQMPSLQKADALFAPASAPPRILKTRIAGEKNADETAIRYDAGGYFPIVGLDFQFSEPESVQTALKNRFYPNEEWRFLTNMRIYRFHTGDSGEVQKNAVFECASTARYWELEAAGERPFAVIPDCSILWEPRELVFLARGTAPWTLAYGNAAYTLPDTGLAIPNSEVPLPAAVSIDETDNPRNAASENGMQGTWLLWGTLLLGVLVLSGLALYTAQSMRRKG